MSDLEILELAIKKDEKAFTLLMQKTIDKIKPSIFSSYKPLNIEDFNDALQNATLKAWQKIETFRGESNFSTWFYIVLKNEIVNILKEKNTIRKYETSLEDIKEKLEFYGDDTNAVEFINNQAIVETAQTILEKKDEMGLYRKVIQQAMSKLNPSHSEIIRLVFEEGKSYQEVSQYLNIPLGTVMSRLYFARRNAQKLIKQYANRNNLQLSNLG